MIRRDALRKFFRVRISLRTALALLTIAALSLGYREYGRRQHFRAIRELTRRGAELWDDFEDPLGPNWWWTGDPFSQAPFPAGFFDRLGAESLSRSVLCTTGHYACTLTHMKVGPDTLGFLDDLVYLQTLELVDVDFVDVSDIESMNSIRGLEILDIEARDLGDEGAPYLEKLTKLRWLRLCTSQMSEAAIDHLRKALPNCEVYWDPLEQGTSPALDAETEVSPKPVVSTAAPDAASSRRP